MIKLKIILASHGELAKGMKQSVELIAGEQEQLKTMCAYVTPNYDLQEQVRKIFDNRGQETLVVVTDIFGGSVNNEFMRYLDEDQFFLISGMSMSLIIELITKLETITANEVADRLRESMSASKDSIILCNDLLAIGKNAEREEDF